MKIALLCGGPSAERGISLNSARSVLDHLGSEELEIVPIYFDLKKTAYQLSPAQLYSNTPSDFDFKLEQDSKLLSNAQLVTLLKSCDITFPVIHGPFGEDGEIQSFLEIHKIPFVGSGSGSCKKAFDKFKANEYVKDLGFYTLPSIVLKIYAPDHRKKIVKFFNENKITRAIVKPATGGSSIGVFSVDSIDEALSKVNYLFSKRVDTRIVIEPFCAGIEFTVIILQNRFGLPVAILPTEIETDYTQHQIFDYRKKYLPTRQVIYHCPPRFGDETVEKIQYQAEQLFTAFGMKDFARFDGWVLPDGNIWFSDFNPVSGMEQNSFLFQQSSRLGFSHRDLLGYVVKNSAVRQNLKFPDLKRAAHTLRKKINVLFGGSTSERQVSLMSGTNVWLKLRKSNKFEPVPHLLDPNGDIWTIPYTLTLNHTVEEIVDHAISAASEHERLAVLEAKTKLRLGLKSEDTSESFFLPQKMTLKEFIKKSPYVFIALHGGLGEDGTLQKILEDQKVKFNGSGSKASAVCMNKWQTSQLVKSFNLEGVSVANQEIINTKELFGMKSSELRSLWSKLRKGLNAKSLIVKPIGDGCSSGIVQLRSPYELQLYINLVKTKVASIPAETFEAHNTIIEMPLEPIETLLFENFIETDTIRTSGHKLKIKKETGWVEITVGVLGKKGRMKSLNPSLTVSAGQVLTVEEKFQGGTGINITPPPKEIMSKLVLNKVKKSIELVANKLGLEGYARIDIFANRETGDVIIIEVNTLPGLTPSTVIYHQALAEEKPLFPVAFLEKIIENSRGYN